jgi:hypothetical protein
MRPVFAVGQRVRVQLSDRNHLRVPLNDEAGEHVLGSLADGEQVEILGWRPSGSHGPRYQVRATNGGLQGWLGVLCLRDPRAATAPDPQTTPVAVAERPRDTGRRFGQR